MVIGNDWLVMELWKEWEEGCMGQVLQRGLLQGWEPGLGLGWGLERVGRLVRTRSCLRLGGRLKVTRGGLGSRWQVVGSEEMWWNPSLRMELSLWRPG